MQKLKTMALSIGVSLCVFFSLPLQAEPKRCETCKLNADKKCTSEKQSDRLKCQKNVCHLSSSCHGCEFCAEISCEICKGNIELCASNCVFYPGCQPLLECIRGWINFKKQYPGCQPLLECLQGWSLCKADCKKQSCENDINCLSCGFCK